MKELRGFHPPRGKKPFFMETELSIFWLPRHQAVWSWAGHSSSEIRFPHLGKGAVSSVSIQLCVLGVGGRGGLATTALLYRVTMCPALSRSVLVHSCCPSTVINSSAFRCQKWSGLSNKLFGHSIYSLHRFFPQVRLDLFLYCFDWNMESTRFGPFKSSLGDLQRVLFKLLKESPPSFLPLESRQHKMWFYCISI